MQCRLSCDNHVIDASRDNFYRVVETVGLSKLMNKSEPNGMSSFVVRNAPVGERTLLVYCSLFFLSINYM